MKYFKNQELAHIYHISEKSVRNWIENASSGKTELELHEEKGRKYIANTTSNRRILQEIVKRGKRYKNSLSLKIVKPSSLFYKLYSPEQILDIIANLDIHREIPLQYSYFGEGAQSWDEYANRQLEEPGLNLISGTIELLELNTKQLDRLTQKYRKVNIFDIGPGNALPVKNLIKHFLDKNKLGKYTAIDDSDDMIDIAERNIKNWFKNKVTIERHIRDISRGSFEDLLASDSFDEDSINLVLFLGGTINNLRSVERALENINNSLGRGDIFMHSVKLNDDVARRFFDFETTPQTFSSAMRENFAVDYLNISPEYYSVEYLFDKQTSSQICRIRLKIATTIVFGLKDTTKRIELNKGETILLWRYRFEGFPGVVNSLDKAGFEILQTSAITDSYPLLLTISTVKTNRQPLV